MKTITYTASLAVLAALTLGATWQCHNMPWNADPIAGTGPEKHPMQTPRSGSHGAGTRNTFPESKVPPSGVLVRVNGDAEQAKRQVETMSVHGLEFRTPAGKRLKLEAEGGLPVVLLELDPNGTRYLANHGSRGGHRIYDQEGRFIQRLPEVSEVFPDLQPRTRFHWAWSRNEMLVATLGFIDEVKPNQYPESDTTVRDMRLYCYSTTTNKLRELEVPGHKSNDGILRLDGITEEGNLLLSQVPPDDPDYLLTTKARFLGVFQIPD